MKHPAQAFVLIGLPFILLSGCASTDDYVCKGIAEGVRCASARDVYDDTHDKDHISPTPPKDDQASNEPTSFVDDEDHYQGRTPKESSTDESAPAIKPIEAKYPSPKPGPVIPLRTPSGVMRIAVNLWEDEQKRLFSAQYIFTEIQARTWVIGEPYLDNQAPISPLRSGIPGQLGHGVKTPLRSN